MVAASSPFLTWFSQWGQVVYFVAQMLFWVAIAVAALLVALQYRRLVSHKIAKHAAKHAKLAEVAPPAEAAPVAPDAPEPPLSARISIEEFVE